MRGFIGNGQFTKVDAPVRLLTVQGEHNPISYWQLGEEVYRLNEYEPVQFDIYGVPMGARWECNLFNWPDLRQLLAPSCDYCASIEAMTGTSNCPIHSAVAQ